MAVNETDIQFDAVLQPYRSLSPNGFLLLMVAAGGLLALIGVYFLLQGAWIVLGFCGFELALLYGAFKLSFSSGQKWERLTLTDKALTVTSGAAKKERARWEFQPQWLTVSMDDPPRHESQLRLTSHGRRLTIGRFLQPHERLEVAQALQAALHRWRLPDHLKT